MRQVSPSYSLSLPCHLLACCILPCHHLHFISCHHVLSICIRVRLMHPSIFPVVRFAIWHSYVLRRSLFVSHCERVLNVLGMDRGLSSGLGIPPVKFRSIWRSFGTPTVNRVTAKSFCVLQQKPPPNSPITLLRPLQALGRSITIVWAKTALHLESPTSLYL